MALTAAQITQVFKIYGIPQSGSGSITFTDLAPRGTVTSWFDFSEPAAKLTTILSALSATQEAEVGALLTEWATITDYSEIRISTSSTGAQGTLADDAQRRENIRVTLGNVIGFYSPPGGFVTVASKVCGIASGGSHRLVR